MTSRDIFIKRVWKGWKYQYNIIKVISDWTVMLYIIVPSFAIFIFVYRSWWNEVPSWLNILPIYFLFFIGYLLSWSGNIRTYVEEGDKVYLIKKLTIFWGIKKWAYLYSLIVQAATICLYFIILLPFLLNHYLLDWNQIQIFALYLLSIKSLFMLFKYHLRRIESRFKNIVFRAGLFILFSWFTQMIYLLWEGSYFLEISIISMLFVILSINFGLRSLIKVGNIDHEINMEMEEKIKNITLLFKVSNEVETPVISKRTRPLLLRKSKRLIKKRSQVNGFLELYLKMFFRNGSYITSYLQIVSITIASQVIIPALWLKILILICIAIMLYIWLSVIWNKIMVSNPLFRRYKEKNFYYHARTKAITTLFLFLFIILLLLGGLTLFITTYFLSAGV